MNSSPKRGESGDKAENRASVPLEIGRTTLVPGHSLLLSNPRHNNHQARLTAEALPTRSDILDRVKAFLPQLAQANTELSNVNSEAESQSRNIENVDESKQYIEMNIAITELEGDSEESDALVSKSPQKPGIQVLSSTTDDQESYSTNGTSDCDSIKGDSIKGDSGSGADGKASSLPAGEWITNEEELMLHQREILKSLFQSPSDAANDAEATDSDNESDSDSGSVASSDSDSVSVSSSSSDSADSDSNNSESDVESSADDTDDSELSNDSL